MIIMVCLTGRTQCDEVIQVLAVTGCFLTDAVGEAAALRDRAPGRSLGAHGVETPPT